MLLKADTPVELAHKSVAQETFDSLPEDEQDWLRSKMIYAHIFIARRQFAEALQYIESLGFDDTYYIAAWSLFDSTARRLMKESKHVETS